jgi:NhaP-type Na+/H+ or K+/H+ antiporter
MAVVLFEGGLTLDVAGFRSAPSVIRRLLTIGVGTTWVATTIAIRAFCGFDWGFSALAASLVVVTGPTVVGPIVRRVRPLGSVGQVLLWEAVLVDPVGVYLALICYEWLTSGPSVAPLIEIGLRVGLGCSVGAAAGAGLAMLLRRGLVGYREDGILTLGVALLIFGLCDQVVPESGLLAVTIAGFVTGRYAGPALDRVKRFKTQATDLAISILFIVLAARLDVAAFASLGAPAIAVVATIIFGIRPLAVILSTWGRPMPWRERLFLMWVAPRGIVAASLASLLALSLAEQGHEHATFLEPFTLAVIAASVVILGLGAPLVARLLGLAAPPRTMWMLVGANPFGRQIASILAQAGVSVLLVDNNDENVRQARAEGLPVSQRNALDPDLATDPALLDVGSVLAITGNAALDALVCDVWRRVLPEDRVFRTWAPQMDGRESRSAHGVPIWRDLQIRRMAAETAAGRGRIVLVDAKDAGSNADCPGADLYWIQVAGGRTTAEPATGKTPPADARRVRWCASTAATDR